MEMIKRVEVVLMFILLVGFVQASEIYVLPSTISIDQGNNFVVNVTANTLGDSSDIYAIQLDIIYDPSILSVNSVNEGDFLSSDGATTIFNSGTFSSGKISNIYLAKNVTEGSLDIGASGEGTLFSVNFTALNSGTLNIGVSGIVWVNSTITNDTVGTLIPLITNGSVVVNQSLFCGDATCNNGETCSSCASDCGACVVDNGGGGGGGSSGIVTLNITKNQTNINTTSPVNTQTTNTNEVSGNSEVFSGEQEETSSKGFLSLTGQVIGNAAKNIVKSWAFYFVIILITIFFVVSVLIRKYRKHKGLNRVSKY